MLDKKKGMFYGMTIGDALGAAVEFQEKGSFEPVTSYRGFGPHGLAPGQWTDDTSMALALADSIAHGWSLQDQLERYLAWRRDGKYSVTGDLFDIGTTTRLAIDEFESSGALEAEDDITASGNGSIMRLAPVVIKYGSTPYLIDKVIQSSQTTHGSRLCVDSCVYMALVLQALMEGVEKEEALSLEWWDHKVGMPLTSRVYAIVGDRTKEPNGSGFVVDSLHAALWAFRESSSFEEAVLKAVNLGDDADTTGAVCGHFAGAYWGYSGIPERLIDGLCRKDMIELYLNPIL